MAEINTKILLENSKLDQETRELLLQAIATRGKWKGFVLASPPKSETGKLAWNVLVSNLAPQRVSTMQLILGDNKEFLRIDKELTAIGLDKLLQVIEPPYRWNMAASRPEYERLRRALEVALENLP